MRDEKGGDDKVLCVPTADPRQEHLRDIHHLDEYYRWRSSTSSGCTRTWSPARASRGSAWVGRRDAESEIERSRRRAKDTGR